MATVFFYLLIGVILHALIQEYILDVSTSLKPFKRRRLRGGIGPPGSRLGTTDVKKVHPVVTSLN